LTGATGPLLKYCCAVLSFIVMWISLFLLYRKKWFLRI